MNLFMALSTKCNQILFMIVARAAAEFEVVDLQVLHAPADLAAPAVALQYLPVKCAVAVWVESQS